jgi:hypothetical protein
MRLAGIGRPENGGDAAATLGGRNGRKFHWHRLSPAGSFRNFCIILRRFGPILETVVKELERVPNETRPNR